MVDQTTQTAGASSGIGVVGNTPAATQAQAAQAASAARTAAKDLWKTKGKHYVTGITVVLLLIVLSNLYDWSFFWLLAAGGVLLAATAYVSEPVKKGPFKDLFSPWVTFARVLGVTLIVGAIASSSFMAVVAMKIDGAEQSVRESLKARQPGYIRTVKNSNVVIPESGHDRFIGVGSVDLINVYTRRCKSIEPEVPFIEKYATSSVKTFSKDDGRLLYETSWTNGRVAHIEFYEPTPVTVVTTPLGQKMPSGRTCKEAW